MAEITVCNTAGFHYNGFWNVLENLNLIYESISLKKSFQKIIFADCCGTWVRNDAENT